MTDDRITLRCVGITKKVIGDPETGKPIWESEWFHRDDDPSSGGYGILTHVRFSYPGCDNTGDKPGDEIDITIHVPDDSTTEGIVDA